MPFVCHVDEATYVHKLRRIVSGTEDDWHLMEKCDLVRLAEPFSRSYHVKEVDN